MESPVIEWAQPYRDSGLPYAPPRGDCWELLDSFGQLVAIVGRAAGLSPLGWAGQAFSARPAAVGGPGIVRKPRPRHDRLPRHGK